MEVDVGAFRPFGPCELFFEKFDCQELVLREKKEKKGEKEKKETNFKQCDFLNTSSP